MNIGAAFQSVMAVFAVAVFMTVTSFAQETSPSPMSAPSSSGNQAAPSGSPNEAEMMKQMMELSKLNENHKLLASLAGTWSNSVQMWMTPGAPSSKSSGTFFTKSIMDGRYFVTNVTGQMKMPGPDGK
jgi:hypothetical protein